MTDGNFPIEFTDYTVSEQTRDASHPFPLEELDVQQQRCYLKLREVTQAILDRKGASEEERDAQERLYVSMLAEGRFGRDVRNTITIDPAIVNADHPFNLDELTVGERRSYLMWRSVCEAKLDARGATKAERNATDNRYVRMLMAGRFGMEGPEPIPRQTPARKTVRMPRRRVSARRAAEQQALESAGAAAPPPQPPLAVSLEVPQSAARAEKRKRSS